MTTPGLSASSAVGSMMRLAAHRASVFVLALATIVGSVWASESTCSVDVLSSPASSRIFSDGFEGGNLSAWEISVPEFSVTEILDLSFAVGLPQGISEDEVLEVQVTTPNGHRYQSLCSPITAEPSRDLSAIRVSGFPYPLPAQLIQQRMVAGSTMASAILKLPVAGTQIVTTSLYGIWKVQAQLVGDPTPCSEAVRFRLVQ